MRRGPENPSEPSLRFGVEPSGRNKSSNGRAKLKKWRYSAVFRGMAKGDQGACVKFSDKIPRAKRHLALCARGGVGWAHEPPRSRSRPRSPEWPLPAVLRPHAELVGGRRRGPHLSCCTSAVTSSNSTPHRHLMIVPGARDEITVEGRAITVTIASPHVPGSPHYRLMLRNGAVRSALAQFPPDLIECQDAYNLPWAAVAHRKRYPRHGACRRLHDRFSNRLCRAALLQVSRQGIRRLLRAHLLFLLRRALPALRRGLCAGRKWRRDQAAGAWHRLCRRRSPGSGSGRVRAGPARPAASSHAWARGRPAAAHLRRTARRREETAGRGRCVPKAPRQPRRQARFWSARARCATRLRPSATTASCCRAIRRTGPSWPGGWRAPTFTFLRWPTRPSGCRLSRPRPPGFRSSASPPERCSTG